MKRTLGILLYVFILIFTAENVFSQQSSAVDSLFYRGISEYRNNNYSEALKMFMLLDKVYPGHNRKTATLLMEGKCYYKSGNYRKAVNIFSELIYNFPKSSYVDDALYGTAECYYKLGKFQKSLEKLFVLIDTGGSELLRRKAAKMSLSIMQNILTDEDLSELLISVQSERGNAVLTIQLAKRYISANQYQDARMLLQRYMDTHKGSSYLVQMQELYNNAEKMGKGVLKIGVILPLSGPFQQEGQSILNGIKYGIDEHNKSGAAKIEIVVKDSKSDVVHSIKCIQELCNDREISVVIGELESNISASIAAVCQERSVPLLIPASSKYGLSLIGENIFQLRADIATRGKSIAEYAVSGLGLKNLVVIAPADEYGKTVTQSFVNTAKSLGAEILSEQWYFGSPENLKSQFHEIRKAGINKMIQDSLIVIVSKDEFKDLYEDNPIVDGVIHVCDDVEGLIDSTNLKIKSIDGIFLPVYTDDLQFVIPQVSFFNIGAKLFGGSFWDNEEVLTANKNYCNGAIFASDFYVEKTNYKYYHFRDSFRGMFHKTPGKFEIYGYDTIKLLLNVAGETAKTRKVITEKLKDIDDFEGMGSYITLTKNRSNSFVHLLQFRDGKIFRIK